MFFKKIEVVICLHPRRPLADLGSHFYAESFERKSAFQSFDDLPKPLGERQIVHFIVIDQETPNHTNLFWQVVNIRVLKFAGSNKEFRNLNIRDIPPYQLL